MNIIPHVGHRLKLKNSKQVKGPLFTTVPYF